MGLEKQLVAANQKENDYRTDHSQWHRVEGIAEAQLSLGASRSVRPTIHSSRCEPNCAPYNRFDFGLLGFIGEESVMGGRMQ
jgi:hypothetical protein